MRSTQQHRWKPSSSVLIVALFLVLTLVLAKTAATDEKTLQRYFPVVTDDQLLNNEKRFQQIMQGSGTSNNGATFTATDQSIWPDKHKLEKIDVQKEINKLNTTYVSQTNWPQIDTHLGSVTAVSFDKAGNVVLFHRCDRVWGQDTFSINNVFLQRKKGPIRNSTVLALDRETGKLVYDWGKNLFYMPHGLTIDHEDNVWLTDVALHQVFKFGPRGSNDTPLMKLGVPFVPGAGLTNFCKPTSVAVLQHGDFFVADGYCNAHILKYAKDGTRILSWGQNTFAGVSYGVAPPNFFAIPHALTLVPEQELVCTADRENGRVQCFFWSNGTFHSQYHSQLIGDRLFSMDYTPAQGGQFIIVNGPTAELGTKTDPYNEVRGYVMDFKSKKVIGKFGPNDLEFSNPHDVAVTADGNEIYVAELNPTRIHKFLHKSLVKSIPLSAAKPKVNVEIDDQHERALQTNASTSSKGTSAAAGLTADVLVNEASATPTHHRPGGTAILVASLMLLFALLTFGLALLIARRRRRGNAASLSVGQPSCMPFGGNNRRHAWDFPAKTDGFKLGGLLMERNKRGGFEKLDQNASDEEETEGPTNTTLSSGRFA